MQILFFQKEIFVVANYFLNNILIQYYLLTILLHKLMHR